MWVASTEENADRLVQALKAFGFDVPKLVSDLFVDPDRFVDLIEWCVWDIRPFGSRF